VAKLYDCPKFETCCAPLCPLAPYPEKQQYLKGEATCYYVRHHAKDEAPIDDLEREIAEAVRATAPTFEAIGGANYREKIRRAAGQPSQRASESAFKPKSKGAIPTNAIKSYFSSPIPHSKGDPLGSYHLHPISRRGGMLEAFKRASFGQSRDTLAPPTKISCDPLVFARNAQAQP